MPKRIYIGGVTVTTTDATINSTFAPYGTLHSMSMIRGIRSLLLE